MATDNELKSSLKRIDGKGYKAYKDIKGQYGFARFQLILDHIQGDPFAAPSRARVRVARRASGFAPDVTQNASRRVAACDFLTRRFYDCCRWFSKGRRGTGKGGLITIDKPGQEILDRSSMVITDDCVEARFRIGLPAHGRKIAGDDAAAMFFEELPRIVDNSLFVQKLDAAALYKHIQTAEDADAIRSRLSEQGLIAFIGDGSLLPRRSGIDERPMPRDQAIEFTAPPEFRFPLDLPNAGAVSGMGIPEGVTLIVGGGYHGKSTLLSAIERGIYNHIPGDGRELAVTVENTQKIRACDGRNIEKTDISPFINNLPFQKDTSAFSTENASGSTSQAANIAEAIEAGARAILLDEDTSATNFMIRDHRMQQLVKKAQEPITPFIDKVRQLYADHNISTVLVMGGSGDYFPMADQIIQINEYAPSDVTRAAHAVAAESAADRWAEGGARFGQVRQRIALPESFNPYKDKDKLKIAARGISAIQFGEATIDIADLEQLVDVSQTTAIGYAIHYASRYAVDGLTLRQLAERVVSDIRENGLDVLTPYITGENAGFRSLDLAAAINRMRSLKVRQA
ncbi:MAG: ABC-ATPase domain-containing protein [Thermodesulfobacteriota bacterium]